MNSLCAIFAHAPTFQNMLSIRIRNWCVPWAYGSGTDACTEPPRQELMRALSPRVRNWCARWACASEIEWCLAPTKIEIIFFYFLPQSHLPRKVLCCKYQENQSHRKSHTWAPLKRTWQRNFCPHTDKKENKTFLIYKEIQKGSGAKSYMRKGFLIYDEMRKFFPMSRPWLALPNFAMVKR
jgi:hypothetical protein